MRARQRDVSAYLRDVPGETLDSYFRVGRIGCGRGGAAGSGWPSRSRTSWRTRRRSAPRWRRPRHGGRNRRGRAGRRQAQPTRATRPRRQVAGVRACPRRAQARIWHVWIGRCRLAVAPAWRCCRGWDGVHGRWLSSDHPLARQPWAGVPESPHRLLPPPCSGMPAARTISRDPSASCRPQPYRRSTADEPDTRRRDVLCRGSSRPRPSSDAAGHDPAAAYAVAAPAAQPSPPPPRTPSMSRSSTIRSIVVPTRSDRSRRPDNARPPRPRSPR